MNILKIRENVFFVGVMDWDRRLFDELIPLPDGTSYNAYIVKGEKFVALIDTVDPSKKEQFLKNLEDLRLDKIDYIISNHAEQDHSGAIPDVLQRYPKAKVVTNQMCKNFLETHLNIKEDKFILINDGDSLDLGGKTLKFIFTPWVHWPETMSTFLVEDGILFSCDFFGSHRATSSLFVKDEYKVVEDAKRYYAEIMMPFRSHIKKNMQKISNLNICCIAPSHGPIYNKPSIIIDAYNRWIDDENIESKIIIPYVSMHGSTAVLTEYLVKQLMNNNIEVVPMNLTNTDIGVFAMELVDAKGIIFASPYVLNGAHPQIVYAAYLVNALKPKLKYAGVIGSYGWGGLGAKQIKDLLSSLKLNWFEHILVKGLPKDKDFELIDSLVEQIKHIV